MKDYSTNFSSFLFVWSDKIVEVWFEFFEPLGTEKQDLCEFGNEVEGQPNEKIFIKKRESRMKTPMESHRCENQQRQKEKVFSKKSLKNFVHFGPKIKFPLFWQLFDFFEQITNLRLSCVPL